MKQSEAVELAVEVAQIVLLTSRALDGVAEVAQVQRGGLVELVADSSVRQNEAQRIHEQLGQGKRGTPREGE